MHYGLAFTDTRKLAYEFAAANNKQLLPNWSEEKMAGKEWLRSFMKRHKLSLRQPEATSLSRATSFNKFNVDKFFSNLKSTYEKFGFGPEDVYNLDETGLTTVQKPGKVVSPCGQKQVGKITSAERGTLVTVCAIIGSTGKAVPPFFVFPRVHFQDHMLHNAPPGSRGAAHTSGWMTGDIFLSVLEHFIKHERPCKEKPKLLILDNHESHISIRAVSLAKENGIVLLTIPPHTSHKLQPLDVAVYGPFKPYYNKACDRWLINHPGQTLRIYDVAGLKGEAYPFAFTPNNIIKGFKSTGIMPFNDETFGEADFLCSSVTDRPLDQVPSPNHVSAIHLEPSTSWTSVTDPVPSTSSTFVTSPVPSTSCTSPNDPVPSTSFSSDIDPVLSSSCTSESNPAPSPSNERQFQTVENFVSPEILKPFPKCGPRKRDGHGRKKGESLILTSSPIKARLEEEFRVREAKKFKNRKTARLALDSSSGESEQLVLDDSDSSWNEECEDDDDSYKIEAGDFIIAEVHGVRKESGRNFVAVVKESLRSGVQVTFYKRHLPSTRFSITNESAFVANADVVTKLPRPLKNLRQRYGGMIYFNIDLYEYSLR
ncbi:uncharacterized protein [Periplaneta americana]|uniref:DDE-1 domain-containing protein n=1 Tax=Periplaneta americana TaxID=6978 RepID=A0ABQ8TLZ7_PERAM|nr:hypothetical protein ANN_09662 [Periplaneta americana]